MAKKADPRNLALRPGKTVWYDPENPFKPGADVFESILQEFGDLAMGKLDRE